METIRISSFLAQCALGSRRKCEALVREGKVKVNGTIVTELYLKIDPLKDRVEYLNRKINIEKKIVLALNKPAGFLCTLRDDFSRKTVIDLVKDINTTGRLFPVGRLDLNSRGLLLMTNDGEFAYRITHPKFNILKTYEALLDNPLKDNDLIKLNSNIIIDGIKVDIKNLKISGGNKKVTISIHEGRKRIIRRIFSELGYEVIDLKRTCIGNFNIGDIKEGSFKILNDGDLKMLMMLN